MCAIDRPPTSLNPYKINPQIVQLQLDPRLPRFADSDDTNDRRDSDSYSQDRQDASHLVPKQRHQGGLKQSRVIH